jgi:Icc-related predicted phosphoesterase
MRIIFASDIHQAFQRVAELLERSDADLYLVTGDLVSRAFFRYRTAWRFMELQQILAGHRPEQGPEASLKQVAQRLRRTLKGTPLEAQASEYLALSHQAERYLLRSYEKLEKILSRHPEKQARVLPGNYDMDLAATALKRRDLHLTCIPWNGWKIAGYGGADVMTPGLPDHLQAPFREDSTGEGIRSEAAEFFMSQAPDLLVTHQPPYGYLDVLPGYGHAGSTGLRDYVDQSSVKLVLSSHHHDQWGAALGGETLFLNPSNFGRTFEVSRVRPGGLFFRITIEEKAVLLATLCQMEKGRLHDIVDYQPIDGSLETSILDEKRYQRLGGRLPRRRHTRPIRQLQKIKALLLGYETPETQELVDELRDICRKIREKGMDVAFDLLGSLNFGMAQSHSDMDVVVYMRGRDCVLDHEDTCGVPPPLAAVFNALKERELQVEVCDSLDLDRIERAIEEEDREDGQLKRFVFYRAVCRPVNVRSIKRVENRFLEKERFRNEMERGLSHHIEILISSVRHIESFKKYETRLRERGIPLSAEVKEAIRNYLRG